MAELDTMTQVKNGLRTAGAWLLGLGWLGSAFAGMAIAFSPSKYPPVFGWVILAIDAAILVSTAHRWVKALPGILGIGTLNALVSVFSGHATNLPSVPIPRSEALAATFLLATSTAISPSFASRKLSLVDRIAFLVYVACIFWGAVDHRVTPSTVMGLATLCLFSAWLYARIRRSHNHNFPGHQFGDPASSRAKAS